MSHGKKEIRQAIKTLETLGCTVEERSGGHAWGRVIAPNGAVSSIWSTPRSAEHHANQLIRWARKNQ